MFPGCDVYIYIPLTVPGTIKGLSAIRAGTTAIPGRTKPPQIALRASSLNNGGITWNDPGRCQDVRMSGLER